VFAALQIDRYVHGILIKCAYRDLASNATLGRVLDFIDIDSGGQAGVSFLPGRLFKNLRKIRVR
jgi:hypothetical protein